MKKRIERIFCAFMAIVIVVISAIFITDALKAYSDTGKQKADKAKIDEINALLAEKKDSIASATSYSDALKIIEESGIDINFTQRNPAVFYYDNSKKLITRESIIGWLNNYIVNYKYSKINFYDCSEEIVYVFGNKTGYTRMHYFSTKLNVEELKGQIGNNGITLSLNSYETPAVSYIMEHTVFYDGELYSYEFDGKKFVRTEVEAVRDKKYFGYDLVITDDVEEIPADLFDKSCLRRIQMSDNVKNISEEAFKDCAYLEEVRLSDNLETFSKRAFEGCISLEEVSFHDKTVRIEDGAFFGCKGLSKLYLPKTLVYIADGAFEGCDNLSVINCGMSREEYNALGLSNKFPSFSGRVLRYDDNIYNGGWVYLKADDKACTFTTVQYVGLWYDCYINSIYTRNSVDYSHTGMEAEAFAYDSFIKSARIRDGVKILSERAFYHTGIEYAYIPASVEEIGIGAYSGCYNLNEIVVDDENKNYLSEDGALFEISGDELYLLCFPSGYAGNYTVPGKVVKNGKNYTVAGIRKDAFAYAPLLNGVSVPEGVIIEEGAFAYYFGEVTVC